MTGCTHTLHKRLYNFQPNVILITENIGTIMARTKVILKILFTLCVWSFVIIGVFKMQGNNIVPQEYVSVPLSGRILLQKDMLRYAETTSTTTDRFDPSEILVDNRTGEFLNCSLNYDSLGSNDFPSTYVDPINPQVVE